MNVLIVYGSTDGHTAAVANYLAERMRRLGTAAISSDVRDLPRTIRPGQFDAILVAGSVHATGYQRRVKRFIRRNLAALRSRPSGFLSVCLSIASRFPEDRKEAEEIPRRFVATFEWLPDHVAVVAGALTWSRYGLLRTAAMKKIVLREMGVVDTRHDQVFTDWKKLDAFAAEFVAPRQFTVPRTWDYREERAP